MSDYRRFEVESGLFGPRACNEEEFVETLADALDRDGHVDINATGHSHLRIKNNRIAPGDHPGIRV